MTNYNLSHLDELESESIFVIREVAAQFERPAILFSGGKDSIVMTYLARKAFFPAKIPFPLLHIDTGHNFQETIDYRDELVKELGVQLVVGSVQESIDTGRVVEEKGYSASRNLLQTVTLLDTIEKYKFDAARKKPAPKHASFRTATNSGSGTLKTSVPNSGISSTVVSISASISGCFLSATGPKWMCGNTFTRKTSRCQAFTLHTSGKLSCAMAFGWQMRLS
jgi:hypothetical protein